MKKVRIICRQSQLSFLQAELVKQKILQVEPGAEVEIIGRSSRGDRELHVPLSSLDGTDFFTEEIFQALADNEADIAVHSLKDISAPHFFSHQAFAIVDRDDVRDIAIFNPSVIEKLRQGKTIVVGTCSPRREEMAVHFLEKALPQLGENINIETKPIRGNVEGRLKQLHDGIYDATILATAGLNRLLRHESASPPASLRLRTLLSPASGCVKELLEGKLLMLLPLFECVPAPCQGAIVAEAHFSNKAAVELLGKITNKALFAEVAAEKRKAFEYGTGCLQKFGVTTISTGNGNYLYAAGEDSNGQPFRHWTNLPSFAIDEADLFSSTDCMKDFFECEWSDKPCTIQQQHVFVANYKALQHEDAAQQLKSKTVWASGTKTWYELAKLGLWVQGSADGLGFENLLPALHMPLLSIAADDICILTHEAATVRWRAKGYYATENYALFPLKKDAIAAQIKNAKAIFWSSFSQYEYYGQFAKHDAKHMCAGGETASLLKQAGIDPIIFPTIKAFEQWRKSFIRLHIAV